MDYVNPFGSYAQGYGQGVQQENTLQQDTRKARDEDYRYKNLMPLEFDEAKLKDRYDNAVLPTQEQGAYDSGKILHNRLIGDTVDTGQKVSEATGYTGMTNEGGHMAGGDYVSQSPTSLTNRADFQRNLQLGGLDVQRSYRDAQAQYFDARGAAGLENAQTRALGHPVGAPGQVGSASMFGSSGGGVSATAPHPATQYGYDPAQHGQAAQSWMQQFHQPNYSTMDPVSQGHMIYGLNQSTGMPMEAAHSVLSTTPYEPAAQQPSYLDGYQPTDQ